jgi:arylsulfatase A-like enzyme
MIAKTLARALLLLLLLLAPASCGPGGPRPEGPNVLLITLDTTRADYISPLGADPAITPQLQALADRSCLFTHALSETNVTNPSHLTIMTGLRAIEHGMVSNYTRVPESLDTLAAAMRRAGYRTAGFPAVPHVGPWMHWPGFDFLAPVEGVVEARENTGRAAGWLRRNGSDPFFLWVHYFDPHTPYEPPPDIAARFYHGDREAGDGPPIAGREFFDLSPAGPGLRRWLALTRDPEYPPAMYAGEIHDADREIGRLLAELAGAGLEEETVVVVVADHGESLGEHGIYYDHAGVYEPQLKIPLIVHVPGLAPRRSDALVSTLDVAPTIGELTGVELRHDVSGLSLVALLEGEESAALAARSTFVHQNAKNHQVAVRQGPWKLIWPITQGHPFLTPRPQLFQLEDDPGELVDLAEAEPDKVRALRRLIQPWIERGEVEKGDTMELDDAARQQLRALGYLG